MVFYLFDLSDISQIILALKQKQNITNQIQLILSIIYSLFIQYQAKQIKKALTIKMKQSQHIPTFKKEQSPQNSQLRNLTIHYFSTISNSQKMVQSIRQALVLQPRFNPLLLFDIVSQGRKHQSKKDWRRYLQHAHVSFDQREFEYFWKHFGFGNMVIFSQFVDILLPFHPETLKEFYKKLQDRLSIKELDPVVKQLFKQFIQYWMEQVARRVVAVKRQLNRFSRKKLQNLIKNDIVSILAEGNNQVRSSNKFKQQVTAKGYKISYNELRRFLQLTTDKKDGKQPLQFGMLYIKRFFMDKNPFDNIFQKKKKSTSIARKMVTRSLSQDSRQQSPRKGMGQSDRFTSTKKGEDQVVKRSLRKDEDLKQQLKRQLEQLKGGRGSSPDQQFRRKNKY